MNECILPAWAGVDVWYADVPEGSEGHGRAGIEGCGHHMGAGPSEEKQPVRLTAGRRVQPMAP